LISLLYGLTGFHIERIDPSDETAAPTFDPANAATIGETGGATT
jgi:hypothetical protein